MNVNRVTKKLRISPRDSVRYQLITAVIFFKKQTLTPTELDILMELVLEDKMSADLSSFCTETTKKLYTIEKPEQFSTKSQNVRNIINKLVKRNLIEKSEGPGKKIISIAYDLDIHHQGNVLLDYNFLSVHPT